MKEEVIFTREEVEKLVKNAYEVGLCDGIESSEVGEREYSSSEDFWKKNWKNWKAKRIDYII